MWHLDIRVRRHRCVIFLSVQKMTRVRHHNTMTRHSANELLDNIMLPEREITLEINIHVIGHLVYYWSVFNEQADISKSKVAGIGIVRSYSGKKSNFTPQCHDAPERYVLDTNEHGNKSQSLRENTGSERFLSGLRKRKTGWVSPP